MFVWNKTYNSQVFFLFCRCSHGCATFLKQTSLMTSSWSWIRKRFSLDVFKFSASFPSKQFCVLSTTWQSASMLQLSPSMLFRNYWLHCSFKATSCHKIYNDSHKRQEVMKAIELYNNLFHVISDKLKLTMPNAFLGSGWTDVTMYIDISYFSEKFCAKSTTAITFTVLHPMQDTRATQCRELLNWVERWSNRCILWGYIE